ncbi:P-loop containing nucleoside triphosphate hydrolase [Phytophthora cactorum]|nr:P-loop containing nucleoside triphosphate hydrolase [Phytophthora cactorum]
MASDSDGNTSSAVVLRSIRDKLVEYKESLLRQLVEEREVTQAASKEQEREDFSREGDGSISEEEAHVEAAEVEEPKPADNGESIAPGQEPTVETENESSAATEEPVQISSPVKTIDDEVILKKRRLAEAEAGSAVQSEKDAVPVKKPKRSKAKSQQPPEETADSNSDCTENPRGALGAVEHQEPLPDDTPYRVVRTSVPPTKYLMQTRRDEEASNRKALHQQQSVLMASSTPAVADHNTSNGIAGIKRPASTPRSSSTSLDSTNAEFEGRLRESVRLHREVNKRSLTVTRKRQLPRLPTPARGKSHWDFLLDEMKWMATDFAQERNWKRVIQHRLATDVIVAQNAESVRQEQENRQMARGIALQISAFWRTMERIAARSRVRFEAAGTDPLDHGEMDDPVTGDRVEDDGKRGKSEDLDVTGTDDGTLTLKYHTIEVARSNGINVKSGGKGEAKPEAVLASTKTHMTYILLALRWMLDLYSSGLNIFLNDQLGMGKATTIVAFLSLIEIVSSQKQPQQQDGDGATASTPEDASVDKPIGPHLIIVSEEELHKWRYYLRIWHPGRRIQLYDGADSTPSYREQLQREWKIKPRSHAQKTEDVFLIALPNDDDDEELDDGERAEPIYCVLCPVSAFAQDREAFVAFTNWQMVVVENEHGGQFDDSACVSALQQLRQRQRRVLCNGQSIENWKNTALRLQYAEFLVREAPALTDDNVAESSVHRVETWPVQELQVERASVAEVMNLYDKSSSVLASLWKASSQDDTPQYMNALLLALSCLSLRRVRSEVESELGKIDEISLSCQPSPSQRTQYRNALSGFAATLDTSSGREERLSVWLQLLLRLREICNCVDIVNDMDKLGHADMRLLTSCSAKLEVLEPLLRRLVLQEGKKVVIYSQFNAMFPILELFLSLLDINFVRVTGSITMQRRALCHFADRPVVRVALASTRLSMSNGRRAVSVFGGEAIVVVDGDWNAPCDAKLRASWAKMAVGGADTLPVYRLHCENTIEASLLRVGASLTEKELLSVPSDMTLSLTIEKPSWWSSTSTSSGGSGLTDTGAMVKLARVAQQVEKDEKYCGDVNELEAPLNVHNVDLDAEEHLLLANTDELTPVEWYAVNYVHGVTDKKQQDGSDGKTVERDAESVEEEGSGSAAWNESNAFLQSNERSFEKLATLEANRQWQEGDAASQLFFTLDSRYNGAVDESALENLFMQMRMEEGMETHFDVYKPPQPPMSNVVRLTSEAGSNTGNQMTFRVSYRVPAPPPVPLPGKSKLDQAVGDLSKLSKSNKKQRTNVAARAGMSGLASGSSANAGAASAGVKRKLESQLGGIKSGSQKEIRVDLEGIPVHDVSEFADDDFWGDTNLDALDSAEWDDPHCLAASLVLVALELELHLQPLRRVRRPVARIVDAGHLKTGSQKSSKKSKTGTGRARKSSMSSDSGRDAWSVYDDIILKKLFELYGANWTLIAQVFNSSTAKRSPRQCYDRYGKIISGSLSTSTTGASVTTATKDGKSGASLKAQRAAVAANVAAAQLTPAVLDTRIGLPHTELLVEFPLRHSLPGLPPPSIVSAPSLVEMTLAHRKKHAVADAGGKKTTGGMDDLKSIKTSFDAIIQCMKHKTSPRRSRSQSEPVLLRQRRLQQQSVTYSTGSSSYSCSSSCYYPTKADTNSIKKAIVSPAAAAKAMPVVVPPPHKSHTDMISLLPTTVLGPDEVIKRSKEAAVVAVQAAAAVASVGRDGSPLSASGDVMLGAGSGFGASVSGSMPRRSHAASLTSEMTAVGVLSTSSVPPTVPAATGAATSGATTAPTSGTWGGNMVQANGLNASASMELNGASVIPGAESQRAPMPVTTSTLLHVLDRMPEIKNKIQSILNRTDCSESQKVAMIARLLSNTNAINNTNAPAAATPNSNTVLSALTADASMLSSSDMLIDTDSPIPMPASLAAPSPSNMATSSALAPQGQFQSPPASQP